MYLYDFIGFSGSKNPNFLLRKSETLSLTIFQTFQRPKNCKKMKNCRPCGASRAAKIKAHDLRMGPFVSLQLELPKYKNTYSNSRPVLVKSENSEILGVKKPG